MEDHTDAENVKGIRQPGTAPVSHAPPATTDDQPKPDLPEDVDISNPQYTGEDEERELEETSDRSPPSYYPSFLAWAVKYRILLEAGAKVVGLFLLVVLALALLLVTLLPPIDPQHRPDVKIPRSFEDLKR